MIKKFLIAGTALAAITAYSVASQPVEAGSCIVASAKGRALNDAKATDKSMKHLKHVISHWARKNKDKVVKSVRATPPAPRRASLPSARLPLKFAGSAEAHSNLAKARVTLW